MQLLCCSHRLGLFLSINLEMVTKVAWVASTAQRPCSCLQHTITTILVCFKFCAPFSKMRISQQVNSRTDLSSYCAQLLRNLENRQSEGLSLTHTLPILNSVITHSSDCLTEGDKDTFHIGTKVEKSSDGYQQPYRL